jgi:hypothetical protein
VGMGHQEGKTCVCARAAGPQRVVGLRVICALQAHNVSLAGCTRKALRRGGAALVPDGVEIGAIRVSASGWEGWVLEGLRVSLGFGVCAAPRLARLAAPSSIERPEDSALVAVHAAASSSGLWQATGCLADGPVGVCRDVVSSRALSSGLSLPCSR